MPGSVYMIFEGKVTMNFGKSVCKFGLGFFCLGALATSALGQSRAVVEPLQRPAVGTATLADPMVVVASPQVRTDLADYAPGDTVIISGSGFDANESVTLLVAHADDTPVGGEGHEPFFTTTDGNGEFTATWYVHPDDSADSEFLLTADCEHGLHAETTFTDTTPGHGVVTSVVAEDGGCVSASATASATDWDVQPGKTYTVTIEDVDDAANAGTDATMPLFIQNTTIGNHCLTGTQVSTGTYVFSYTVPLNSCATSTINYGACNSTDAKRARGDNADADPATTTNGVHFSASADCLGGVVSCSSTGACCDGIECLVRSISNCVNQGGTYMGTGVPCTPSTCSPPECTVSCPDPASFACKAGEAGETTCSAECDASYSDSSSGTCPTIITRTWTCSNAASGSTKSCTQEITVDDTTPPSIEEREDKTVDCKDEVVFDEPGCSDDCGACSVAQDGDDVTIDGACPQEFQVTRCWIAKDDCGNPSESSCQTVYVVDTTPPVVTCPEDCEVECGEALCFVPLCDDESCACGGEPSCTDDCGECSVNVSCEFVEGGCESPAAGVTPPPRLGSVTKTFSSGDNGSPITASTCPNVGTCTQTIKIVDTTPPVITCSADKTVQVERGKCCATVNFTSSATDTCDDTPSVECSAESGACFGVGTTEVNCVATDDCSNPDGCSFTVDVRTSICGYKKYDYNADGKGDFGICGWKVVLSGAASATTYTSSNGRYCFNDLAPGHYTVKEIAPNSSWVATSPTSCEFDLECPETCSFSNVCLGSGGGHTIGYWSNKNGESKMNDGGSMSSELSMLSNLNLRNATGGNFNPTSYSSFRTWLLGASATNMSYMLSAQLAAMKLNVEAWWVDPDDRVHAPGCGEFLTVSALMTAANSALGADGYTPSGDPNRTLQECLKNALDRANNNQNFVQCKACYFHYPY